MKYKWGNVTGSDHEIRQAIEAELRAHLEDRGAQVRHAELPEVVYPVHVTARFSHTAEVRPGKYVVYIPATLAIEVHAESAEHAQRIGEQLRDHATGWESLAEFIEPSVEDLPELDEGDEDCYADLRAAIGDEDGDGISGSLYVENEPVTVRDVFLDDGPT